MYMRIFIILRNKMVKEVALVEALNEEERKLPEEEAKETVH